MIIEYRNACIFRTTACEGSSPHLYPTNQLMKISINNKKEKKCVQGFLFHVLGFLFWRPSFPFQRSMLRVLVLSVSSVPPSCELRKFEANHLIFELGCHTRACLTWQHHSFSYTSALTVSQHRKPENQDWKHEN